MIEPFTWRDGERVVRFGRGTAATAGELLGDGYALLTTGRARSSAAALVDAADSVHEVGSGLVDELAAELLGTVPEGAELIVALGGGRVIDAAKAVAAARGDGVRVAAVPTTLSAAEMTRIHRFAKGAPPSRRVRPAIVVNDPALSASQPPAELAASAANSLAHAAEGAITAAASPIPRLAAAEAASLIDGAYTDGEDEPDRDALALAALLSGYTIDASGYGLHHVLSQTLVRVGGVGHGPANAALLPHTLAALARRQGGRMLPGVARVAYDLARRADATRLRDLAVERDVLERCADAASERAELENTPPIAERAELLALYEAAY